MARRQTSDVFVYLFILRLTSLYQKLVESFFGSFSISLLIFTITIIYVPFLQLNNLIKKFQLSIMMCHNTFLFKVDSEAKNV
jgi:hypothetical protein